MGTDTSLPIAGANDWLRQRFTQFEDNRKTIQLKWDRNHLAFIRQDGPEVWKEDEGKDWRSRTYLGKTREKVMAATALIIDILLQSGKVPYAFKPSRWQNGELVTPDDEMLISQSIDAMTAHVDQQLVDTHADRQLMKHAMSIGLYGKTWGKKIVHNVKRSGWRKQTLTIDGIEDYSRVPSAETWGKWSTQFMAPGWAYVPVWDIFWDLEAGNNIQESAGLFHRQIVSPFWMRSKIGKPYFITNNIIAAIKEVVPNQATSVQANVNDTSDSGSLAPMLRDVRYRTNTLTYREYWGRMPRSHAEAIETELATQGWAGEPADLMVAGADDAGDEVEVLACTCGSYIVRYCRNEPNNRPFVTGDCEDNIEEETPWGIADNCEPLQMVINGAMRAFEDNKKLAANVILAVKRRLVEKMPNTIKPGMKLEVTEECDDARKAIQQVIIQDVGQSLVSLLEMALPMLDDASMVPRIAQGFTDPNVQTATEVSVRQVQASKYIGMLIRNLDEGIIEPMIEYLYGYNMDDPDVVAGKGNYTVQALGFSAYQNKVERLRKVQELLALALSNPSLEKMTKLENLYREVVKATDLDPDFVIVNQDTAEPTPPDPMVQAQMEAEQRKLTAEATAKEAEAGLSGAKAAQIEAEQANRIEEVASVSMLNEAKTVLALEQAKHAGDKPEVRNVDGRE
jgi:hypothetical protein